MNDDNTIHIICHVFFVICEFVKINRSKSRVFIDGDRDSSRWINRTPNYVTISFNYVVVLVFK
jgi:hypothetical protein